MSGVPSPAPGCLGVGRCLPAGVTPGWDCREALVPFGEAGNPEAVEPLVAGADGADLVGATRRLGVALPVGRADTATFAGGDEPEPKPEPIGGR
jgi:hypothetical protein